MAETAMPEAVMSEATLPEATLPEAVTSTWTRFMRALRAAEVRVSSGETLEALRVVDLLGWQAKGTLKTALSLTLAKSLDEKERFDACFDRFFAAPKPLLGSEQTDSAQSESAETQREREERSAFQARVEPSAVSISAGATGLEAEPMDATQFASALGRLLQEANREELALRLRRAAETVGVEQIRFFTQRGLFTRRLMEQLGVRALDREIDALEQQAAAGDATVEASLERLRALRHRFFEGVRDFVEGQRTLYAAQVERELREKALHEAPLYRLERGDQQQMRVLLRRLARRLRARYLRRRRLNEGGQLALQRTLRRNMGHDGVLIDLCWKARRREDPQVFVICDVSGSVREVARFLLMFIHSLADVLPKARAFVFASRLTEVSQLLRQSSLEEALDAILEKGHGATDYGQAWQDLDDLCDRDISRRSSILVLGDARSNHLPPRQDLLRKWYRRAHWVCWLNPEPPALWDQGDSVMSCFASACHRVMPCSTLKQLERAVDRLLAQGLKLR